jgi:hypothetical protein
MEAQLNPYQYQQAAVETQQARIVDFIADNPTINLTEPAPPNPKVEIVSPGDPIPPLEAPAPEHSTRRSFFSEVAVGSIQAIAGVALATASAGMDLMEEQTYQKAQEQEQQKKIREALASIAKKEKPLENKRKTALGKTTKDGQSAAQTVLKQPTKILVQAA